MGITTCKWLQAIRDQNGITDPNTAPDPQDEWGVTLLKLLTVYNQI